MNTGRLKNIRKWLIRVSVTLVALVLLSVVLLSPVVKRYIENNSVDAIGRKVVIGSLTLNVFSGHIHVTDLDIFDADADTVWLHCDHVHTYLNMWKLLDDNFEFSDVRVDGLNTWLVQDGKKLNFDDLLELNRARRAERDSVPSSTNWSLRDVQLRNSTFNYVTVAYQATYTAAHLNVWTPIIQRGQRILNFGYDFQIATGGMCRGHYNIDVDSLNYDLHLESADVNLATTFPYVHPFIAFQSVSGLMDTDIYMEGNHSTPDSLETAGRFTLKEVEVVDSLGTRIAAIGRLDVYADAIQAKSKYYDFGNIAIDRPFVRFETYHGTDNWTRLLRSPGERKGGQEIYTNPFVIIADYIKQYVRNYFISIYFADHLAITNGSAIYNDFRLEMPFRGKLENILLQADSLSTQSNRARLYFETLIGEQQGKFATSVSVNPRDYKDMELTYLVHKLPLEELNPFLYEYTGTSFSQGELNYTNTTRITNGELVSENHFIIVKPELGEMKRGKPLRKLAVKSAVVLLKDPDGNIDVQVPIRGNLDDPKYKFKQAFHTIFHNSLKKIVRAPGKLFRKRKKSDD